MPRKTSGILKTVGTYHDAFQARIDKNLLESEGITSYLLDEFAVGINWNLTQSVGGVKLQVPANQFEQASNFLKTSKELFVDDERAWKRRIWSNSSRIARRRSIAYRGAIVGLLLFPLQLYVSWLLFRVAFTPGEISIRYRIKLAAAVAINIPAILILALLAQLCLVDAIRFVRSKSTSLRIHRRSNLGQLQIATLEQLFDASQYRVYWIASDSASTSSRSWSRSQFAQLRTASFWKELQLRKMARKISPT